MSAYHHSSITATRGPEGTPWDRWENNGVELETSAIARTWQLGSCEGTIVVCLQLLRRRDLYLKTRNTVIVFSNNQIANRPVGGSGTPVTKSVTTAPQHRPKAASRLVECDKAGNP